MPIHLLGTSHISPESAKTVAAAVRSGTYDLIALELDQYRLQQLLSGTTERASFFALARSVGVTGALFAKLGHWVQIKLGGRIGMTPGEEMRAAVHAAAEHKLPVALIDQPIQVTLRTFSREFTFWEKMKFFIRSMRFTRITIDLRKTPDEAFVKTLIEELERVSPVLAKVLLHDRNRYMVRKLQRLKETHPDAHILAVVGAGHVPGMRSLLQKP